MATEEQIRALAYTIWEAEGCPAGKDRDHYFRARRILEEQETSITEHLTYTGQVVEATSQPASRQRGTRSTKRTRTAVRKTK